VVLPCWRRKRWAADTGAGPRPTTRWWRRHRLRVWCARRPPTAAGGLRPRLRRRRPHRRPPSAKWLCGTWPRWPVRCTRPCRGTDRAARRHSRAAGRAAVLVARRPRRRCSPAAARPGRPARGAPRCKYPTTGRHRRTTWSPRRRF